MEQYTTGTFLGPLFVEPLAIGQGNLAARQSPWNVQSTVLGPTNGKVPAGPDRVLGGKAPSTHQQRPESAVGELLLKVLMHHLHNYKETPSRINRRTPSLDGTRLNPS